MTISYIGTSKNNEGLVTEAGKKILMRAKLILVPSEGQQTLRVATIRTIFGTPIKAKVMA